MVDDGDDESRGEEVERVPTTKVLRAAIVSSTDGLGFDRGYVEYAE